MTTRYRVEYALTTHRRDQLIEWIKALLAVPFVLYSQPTDIFTKDQGAGVVQDMAQRARRRYAEILSDVEDLITDHIVQQNAGTPERSKLKLLVPSIGLFFTPLRLREAFAYQDSIRCISFRRFVPPSFNDIRLILNSAQVLALVHDYSLQMVTFDGDVTLYPDGDSLTPENPVIPRLLDLLRQDIKIGIVTAAGYTESMRYNERLYGLLDAVFASDLSLTQKRNLVILGGESNYMFRFDETADSRLRWIPREDWLLDEMKVWTDEDIKSLLDLAEATLRESIRDMRLDATVLRKDRAIGIVPNSGKRFAREQLEETVLMTQKRLEATEVGRRLPFCAFNGGNDIFVDIGDKSWGVRVLQKYLGGISSKNSLHIGDQFLSVGANDFKARNACTTAWIASPTETVELLDELEAARKASKRE